MTQATEEHLLSYLSDVYSIEEQALAQLRSAPEAAGFERLAAAFRDHFPETERHAELVEGRLEALGGSPSRLKDALMRLGGKGMLLFARVQPDTPGKLIAHAHAYEAFERACYEMIARTAKRAGDSETVSMAHRIRDEERAMTERLAGLFDEAADASLRLVGEEGIEKHLLHYLADAHGLEVQARELLDRAPDLAGDARLETLYQEHLERSRQHALSIEERMEALGSRPSKVKDAALGAGGVNWAGFFRVQGDTPAKLAVFVYGFEHLQIAGYRLLRRVAERAADETTAGLADSILAEKEAMAERLLGAFDAACEAVLADETVSAE